MMAEIEIDFASKRNKIIGIAVSAVFHALLLLLFVFMGLSYQVPPPPEYGIEVDMGGGGGGGGGGRKSGEQVAVQQAPPAPSVENVSTQNIEETAPITTTKQPNPTPIKTPVEPTQTVEPQTVNPAALFPRKTDGGSGTGSGGGTGTGTGTGIGSGTGTGSGTGDGSGNGNGIGNSNGDFYLKGRPVMSKAFPASKPNLEGIVVVDFRADRAGNVIYAKAGGRRTTINDSQIWKACEEAALKSKFRAKSDAEIEERGEIIYKFVIQ